MYTMQVALRAATLFLTLAQFGCDEWNSQPTPPSPDAQPLESDGWDDPPGSGLVFVLDRIGLSPVGTGIDLDGDGDIDAAMNEAWQPLLSRANETMQASVYSGRVLVMAEIAGLCDPYAGEDPAVCIKFYDANDTDGDPTNNLCGEPGCGQFVPDPTDFEEGQSIWRSVPGPVVDHRTRGDLERPMEMELDSSLIFTITRYATEVTVPDGAAELRDGIMAGVCQAADLAEIAMPVCDYAPVFCETGAIPEDLSVVEYLVMLGFQPDIDMDGDGLESFELDADARVTRCHDGDGRIIEGEGCLSDPGMQDGYSLSFSYHAVPATLDCSGL